jgi:hypothetical protein
LLPQLFFSLLPAYAAGFRHSATAATAEWQPAAPMADSQPIFSLSYFLAIFSAEMRFTLSAAYIAIFGQPRIRWH